MGDRLREVDPTFKMSTHQIKWPDAHCGSKNQPNKKPERKKNSGQECK